MNGGVESVEEAEDDVRAFGLPDEALVALRPQVTVLEIEPENWRTVWTWTRVQTQWRVGPGGRYALDYTAVDVAMRRLGIEDPDGLIFGGLQLMEMAAVREMAKG